MSQVLALFHQAQFTTYLLLASNDLLEIAESPIFIALLDSIRLTYQPTWDDSNCSRSSSQQRKERELWELPEIVSGGK